MGVHLRDHVHLGMTGITLDGLDIPAVQLQLVGDARMAQAVETHLHRGKEKAIT